MAKKKTWPKKYNMIKKKNYMLKNCGEEWDKNYSENSMK